MDSGHPQKNRSRRRRQILAMALGVTLLVALELALRLMGFGGPGNRPDPFFGFSTREPLFVQARSSDNKPIYHTRPDRLGTFNLQSFHTSKSESTFRLFCLGGSSTFGFPYTAKHSFCADLEAALQELHPEKQFEVINCGGMSYGSRRVLNILREVSRYQPDGLIVYMGHNEYVERRSFAPLLEEPAWYRSLRQNLSRVRIYVLGEKLLHPFLDHLAAPSDNPYGVGPTRDDSRRLPRSAKEDRLIEEHFRFALTEMANIAQASGIPLFLVNPAANLRDWAPEASTWRRDLDPFHRHLRDRLTEKAGTLLARNQLKTARSTVDEALRLDSGAAALQFLRGQILLREGENAAARRAFQKARDLDAAPIRIRSNLSRAIRETWVQQGLPSLDADQAMAHDSPGHIVGHEMVLDYCHPSRQGDKIIARLLLQAIQSRFWPEQTVAALPSALALQDSHLQAVPDSAFGAAWMGQMKLRQGERVQAMHLFRAALSRDPRLATAHEGLGRSLAMSGELDEAAAELQAATRLAPSMDTAWNNLGLVYLARSETGLAIKAFRQALRLGPDRSVIHINLARALRQQGRLQAARAEIQTALQQSPSSAPAWVELGEIALAAGDGKEAARAYGRALELDPTQKEARQFIERATRPVH